MPDDTFSISCFKLLEQYPLYNYRKQRDERWTLSVLLIGTGDELALVRDNVLSNGQLLDTALTVTVRSETAAEDGAELMGNAVELGRFIDIQGVEGAPRVEWKLGTLCYVPGLPTQTDMKEQYDGQNYIFISTGDAERNRELAEACGRKRNRLVACLDGDGIRVFSPKEELISTGMDDKYKAEIDPIAYNLHFAYMKGNNPHATHREIRESYLDDYNYQSNIECALHIRTKLACCGIDTRDLASAGEEFARMLEEDARQGNRLLNSLAQLEHQRWCISKLLQGFRKPEDMGLIYSEPGITTHSKKKGDKWHVCLARYGGDDTPCRQLRDEDWENDDPDAIPDLDELDKQTLRVHKICGEIAEAKFGSCEKMARRIRDVARDSLGHMEGSYEYANGIYTAIEQLRAGKRSAAAQYNRCEQELKGILSGVTDDPAAAGTLEQLKRLNQHMGAVIEFASRKDYKEQNLVLVRQIPAALSSWGRMRIVKLMADQERDCVSSAWQLEPASVDYVDLAESFDEMAQIRARARRIDRFLYNSCNGIKTHYHILVPREICRIENEYPEFFEDWDCTIWPVDSGDTNDIRPAFVKAMKVCGAAYIDMTGGKPALISVAEGYVRNSLSHAFFVRDDKIRNFYESRGLENWTLGKGITVQEMFEQADAIRIKCDSGKISDQVLQCYRPLWDVAYAHAKDWYSFCFLFLSRAYSKWQDDSEFRKVNALTLPQKFLRKAAERLDEKRKTREWVYWEILDELVNAGIVQRDEEKDLLTFDSEPLLAALRNSGKALEYYIFATARETHTFTDVTMSWLYAHSGEADAAKNEVDVLCTRGTTSLFISAKNVSVDTVKSGNFLNYVCYEVTCQAARFGLNPRCVLAAPNVSQFEKGERSALVKHAMSRGVYLLGDVCFQSGRLGEVLDKITRGERDWCEFLLPSAAAV